MDGKQPAAFLLLLLKHFRNVLAGIAHVLCSNLFGRTRSNNLAATIATFGTHVDNVIGRFDDIQIVLND